MLEVAVGVPDEDAGCDGHRCDYEHCHGERNARHPSWFTVNKRLRLNSMLLQVMLSEGSITKCQQNMTMHEDLLIGSFMKFQFSSNIVRYLFVSLLRTLHHQFFFYKSLPFNKLSNHLYLLDSFSIAMYDSLLFSFRVLPILRRCSCF